MNFFRKIKEQFKRWRAWHTSRKMRRARRAASAVADTAAAGTGFALRTVVKAVVTVLLVFITTGMILACIFAVYVKTCMTGLDLQRPVQHRVGHGRERPASGAGSAARHHQPHLGGL